MDKHSKTLCFENSNFYLHWKQKKENTVEEMCPSTFPFSLALRTKLNSIGLIFFYLL